MRSSQRIAVVLPALDEAGNIAGVLQRIPDWVDEIVVADNGSTDGTADVARASGARVTHAPRRGYGSACLAGIRAVRRADVLVFLDADGSDHPEQMQELVDPILDEDVDLVIGSRRLGTLERGAMSLPQRFGNLLAPALIRWLWGVRFTDLGPFRAVRASALARLGMDDPAFGWTVQMQVRAVRLRLSCREVPVAYSPRSSGCSKVSGTLHGVIGASRAILGCIAAESVDSLRHGVTPGDPNCPRFARGDPARRPCGRAGVRTAPVPLQPSPMRSLERR